MKFTPISICDRAVSYVYGRRETHKEEKKNVNYLLCF